MTVSKSYILYMSSKKSILTERKGLCDLFWISPRTYNKLCINQMIQHCYKKKKQGVQGTVSQDSD
jgi:hypothetical protein